MSFIIDNKPVAPPSGLVVKNYLEHGVFRFTNRKRKTPPDVNAVVVHETVTTSAENTVAVLKARGLGVHLIAAPNGDIYQHADLLTDEMWHASHFNALSVGIEVVNPYEPKFLPKTNSPWKQVIDAPWAVGGKYVLPTIEQAIAVTSTINFLTSALANPIAIPQRWPGLQGTHRLALGRVKADAVENPGIHAHMYFGHADGAWLVLFAWLTMEAGLSYEEAYKTAAELAQGATSKGVLLDSYFAANPYLEPG